MLGFGAIGETAIGEVTQASSRDVNATYSEHTRPETASSFREVEAAVREPYKNRHFHPQKACP